MDMIIECFDAFLKDRCERYRLGKAFYQYGARPGDQYCQNAYLKTEADVQVKFGGFLEQWLFDRDPGLVVHAEMPIYGDRSRADLTVHRVSDEWRWTSRQHIIESLESVIEIKYANVRRPLYDLENGGIEKDLRLLKSLPQAIRRYLLLVDEAEGIDSDQVRDFLENAKSNQVTILSNNISLIFTANGT